MRRREFVNRSLSATGSAIIAPAYIKNMISDSPAERINIAVAGISGDRKLVRGMISRRRTEQRMEELYRLRQDPQKGRS